jgi:NAD+ synthase
MNLDAKRKDIVKWLHDYRLSFTNNPPGYVIGLSGGIDSALSAALAVEAVGKENVYGVILPCAYDDEIQRTQDIVDAKRVANHLGINFSEFNLGNVAEEFAGTLQVSRIANRLAGANIKARLRMTALRTVAELKGMLVLGTTNRTEDLLGYFTKGGDGGSGVDVEPIAGLYKYEVRELLKYYEFPEDLVNRTPTAGLWDDQTDEDELGISYVKLDAYFELRNSASGYIDFVHEYATNHLGLTSEQCIKIDQMLITTEHKRNMPPSPKFHNYEV